MTTPTNENRDTGRAESAPPSPETRHRLDLSVTKVAAGACAAALAAAVGSKLGVAGTIAGAAVASAVATSAGAVIGHSLERGKTAARKAMPTALAPVGATQARPSLADRALADSGLDEAVVLAKPAVETRRPWKKPLIAVGLASFLIGTGAVTALEVARKGEFPGYHSNVFTNDPGQGGGSNNQPATENPGGSTSEGTKPTPTPTPTPTPSGSSSSSPSSIPSTPPNSGSTSSVPSAPSTPSTGSPTSSTPAPTTDPTSSTGPTTPPGTAGPTAPGSPASGAAKATPTGGPTG